MKFEITIELTTGPRFSPSRSNRLEAVRSAGASWYQVMLEANFGTFGISSSWAEVVRSVATIIVRPENWASEST